MINITMLYVNFKNILIFSDNYRYFKLTNYIFRNWERKELNNILKINSGRDYKQLNSGNIPVYGTGGYMLSVNDKLSDTDAAGIGRKGTIDKPLYLKAPFWTVDTLFYCTSRENSDVKFIYLLFQIINWKRYDESTGVPSLSKNTISNIKTYVPKIKEQDYISKLFFSLDNTLQLHERKCEELALIKKALLQKLFPKKDEFKPEVRYKNFSDAWEQRKLGEVASYRNGKAHEKDINESGKYIVINSKFVSSNGTVRKYSNKMIAPLNKGEISFVLSDVPNGKALARTFLIDQDDTYTLNQRIAGILPKQEVDPYFMSTLMNRNSYFLRFDDGVGQTNLSKRDVTEWNTFYPSHAEQKKIGGFLQQLDSLITLHQRKLEKLKQLKKFLLQNMFI